MFRYFSGIFLVFASKGVKKFELRDAPNSSESLPQSVHNGEAEAEQVVIAMESLQTSSQLWVVKTNADVLFWFQHVPTRKS